MTKQCEGWRRRGGAFTLGPVQWSQCENEAVVILTVQQEATEELPSCLECWNEALDWGIKVLEAKPLAAVEDAE